MKIIICVDDHGGLAFNKRRQSRDSVLIKDVCELAGKEKIYMLPYTEKLFADIPEARIKVSERPLAAAGRGDFCFSELVEVGEYADKIEELIIYRWNRSYPSDVMLDVSPEGLGLKLCGVYEFVGTSHEKITREIYK